MNGTHFTQRWHSRTPKSGVYTITSPLYNMLTSIVTICKQHNSKGMKFPTARM